LKLVTYGTTFSEPEKRKLQYYRTKKLRDICRFKFIYRSELVLFAKKVKTEGPYTYEDAVQGTINTIVQNGLKRAAENYAADCVKRMERTEYMERAKANGIVEIDLTVEPSGCKDLIRVRN
jgi:allophanate hydrolase subunit 1